MRNALRNLLLAATLFTPAAFGQDACESCLKGADADGGKCQAAAKSQAEALACDQTYSKLHKACREGACKGKPQAKTNPCEECRKFVVGDAEACLKAAKTPATRESCDKRADAMHKSCQQRFCVAESPKASAPAKPAAPPAPASAKPAAPK